MATPYQQSSESDELQKIMLPAGRKTSTFVPQTEPLMQQKKRVTLAPGSSLNKEFFINTSTAPTDYVLLGNQDKFMTNVKYWNRNAKRHPSPSRMNGVLPSTKLTDSGIIAPMDSVDAKKPSKPSDPPLTKQLEKPLQTLDINKNPALDYNSNKCTLKADKIKKILDNENLDREKENVNVVNKTEVEAKKSAHKNKVLKEVMNHAECGKEKNDLRKVDSGTEGKENTDKSIEHIQPNDGTQLQENSKKLKDLKGAPVSGVGTLQAERDSQTSTTQPLEVSAEDHHHHTKSNVLDAGLIKSGKYSKSEYQRQFDWKTPVKSSPLLNSLQIVQGGQNNFSKAAMIGDTEYSRQYQPWQYVAKNKRHRPEPQPSPVHPKSVLNEAPHSDTPKSAKQTKRSRSVDSIPQHEPPAGMPSQPQEVCATTEYPKSTPKQDHELEEKRHGLHKKYRHLTSEYNANFKPPSTYMYLEGAWKGQMPADANNQAQSWYSEVLELRQKANAYRKRAEGTHFSREHLVQLMAQQSRLWQDVSSRRSLSGLSLEPPTAPLLNKQSTYNYGAIGESRIPHQDSCDDDTATHHSDCVTPTVNNTLSSPPKPDSTVRPDNVEPSVIGIHDQPNVTGQINSDVNGGKEADTGGKDLPVISPLRLDKNGRECKVRPEGTRHTYGSPTYDSHSLRNDDTSIDHPQKTGYRSTPVKRDEWRPLPDHSDTMSSSTRSVGSNCSLASDVLKRSQKRRNFWNKNAIPTN